MNETIAMVLGTAGWVTGILLLVTMAALPLLESTLGRRSR